MSWTLEYLPEAEKDLKALDGSQRLLVLKAIKKCSKIPCLLKKMVMEKLWATTAAPIWLDF